MREILFRGKRKDNGEWVDGDLRHGGYYFGDAKMYIFVPFAHTIINHPVVPETVGEYTGMLDKNGKRIFEGDIVHCIAILDEADCVVIFEDGEFRLVPTKRYATYVTGCGFHALRNFEKEVIGNIHDNPELLGGGNA